MWIQSFPDPGVRKKVSIDGGAFPRWSRDDKELFYFQRGVVMSVALKPSGSSLTAAAPAPLFPRAGNNTVFSISPSGRFLLQRTALAANTTGPTGTATPTNPGSTTDTITVMLNWVSAFDAAKRAR